MKKLHKNSVNTDSDFDSKEGRREFLSNNSNSVRRPSLGAEEVDAFCELGSVLRRISSRLREEENYEWISGDIYRFELMTLTPEEEAEYEYYE